MYNYGVKTQERYAQARNRLLQNRSLLDAVIRYAASHGMLSIDYMLYSTDARWFPFRADLSTLDAFIFNGTLREGDTIQNMFCLASVNLPQHIDFAVFPFGQSYKSICESLQSNALGGLWYTRSEVEAARIAVTTMNNTYKSLSVALQNKYKSRVDAVNAGWDKYDKAWVFYTSEQAVGVGKQAQEVLKQMSLDAPNVVVVPETVEGTSLDKALDKLGDKASKFIDAASAIALVGVGVMVLSSGRKAGSGPQQNMFRS